MKLLIVLWLSLSNLCFSGNDNLVPEQTAKVSTIEVYYFHFTRRCATCTAVEQETVSFLKSQYAKAYTEGKITFKSLNLDEQAAQATAEKFKVSGQTLLIRNSKNSLDLTNEAFMYAKSEPLKFQQKLKSAVDSLLK